MQTSKKNTILISTGGTGGHVFPAYSLAKNLIKNNYKVEIVTDQRGFKFLQNYKDLKLIINNSTTLFNKTIISFIWSIFFIFSSYLKSLLILYRSKPSLVFGMGGHASFPICLAAKTFDIPFVIYENNLFLGKSNKYLMPLASKIFLAYEDVEGIKKKFASKVFISGNIIRDEILNFNNEKKYLENELNILILGGSQAAKSFGELLPKIFKQCVEGNIKIKIIQQCAESQNNALEKYYKNLKIDYELFNFTDNILEYFSKAELVITRAGSSATAELINCKKPFISIPYPYSADSHQDKNAAYFEKKGYSFLIKENEVSEKLFPLIKLIYNDKAILNKLIDEQKKHSDKNVFFKINNEVKNLIHERN
ncbi:UDP-N-acetylglucosamine--N-acetylmuramyl-(pentapeptide) pyrophosphoryl-undecaprenol N-acetylglucosamine transferase [Pelagibacteraceae bacterium]|nr:UDP-N-acetylglucosamine--N-acetylmuramyl-(pentapeptide) pyrophosphoryl-undecaprenol N-acetylglucosamine transferase [Pelagibacteraceae bacterium]